MTVLCLHAVLLPTCDLCRWVAPECDGRVQQMLLPMLPKGSTLAQARQLCEAIGSWTPVGSMPEIVKMCFQSTHPGAYDKL